MRRTRKNRHKGGVEYTEVYECKLLKSGKEPVDSTCSKEFAKANNFEIIETADDGNCFYDTISKFGAITSIERLNKPHLELREELVIKMLKKKTNVKPYIIHTSNTDLIKQIMELGKPGTWNSDTADLVSQYASIVFNIILNIFNVNKGIVYKITTEPLTINRDIVEVNMLRINNNHYKLLLPKTDDSSISNNLLKHQKKSASRSTRKHKNETILNKANRMSTDELSLLVDELMNIFALKSSKRRSTMNKTILNKANSMDSNELTILIEDLIKILTSKKSNVIRINNDIIMVNE